MANIKVNRNEIIATLTIRVSDMETALAKYETDHAKAESAQDAWRLKAFKEATKSVNILYPKQDLRVMSRFYDKRIVDISFSISGDALSSKCPELPAHPNCADWQVSEIKQFIKFLSLSDDEYVIMNGVLKDLVKYL